jgi:hypothetical protein
MLARYKKIMSMLLRFPKKGDERATKNGRVIHTNHENKKSPKLGIVDAVNVLFLVKTSK